MNAVDKRTSPATNPRTPLVRTVGFYAFVYLILVLIALPWLIPRMPASRKTVLIFLLFAPLAYVFVDWLGAKLRLWERTLPANPLKALLIVLGATALVILETLLSDS